LGCASVGAVRPRSICSSRFGVLETAQWCLVRESALSINWALVKVRSMGSRAVFTVV